MIITYHGLQFFKVSQGDMTIALNPISQEVDTKVSKFGANMAISSAARAETNGFDTVTYGDKNPFIIDGPGEYESHGVYVRGLLNNWNPDDNYLNTSYLINFDGIKLLFLGLIKNKESLSKQMQETFESVDVVFAPLGVITGIDPHISYSIAKSFEPSVIIPMSYDKDSLDQFLKEAGGAEETLDKLTFKKSDLAGKEAAVYVVEK